MRLLSIFFVILFSIALSSCATIPAEKTLPEKKNLSWNTREQTLSHIQHWNLSALVSIRDSDPKNNLTANMQWEQTKNGYTISLFGPLGAGSAKLTGSTQGVTLATADGKTFNAATVELLLAQQTNWHLPVSNLYYWIRGLPVPTIPAQKQWDEQNRLIVLKQQGWLIQFLDYKSTQEIDLPRRIFLFNSQLNVKIIINEWKI